MCVFKVPSAIQYTPAVHMAIRNYQSTQFVFCVRTVLFYLHKEGSANATKNDDVACVQQSKRVAQHHDSSCASTNGCGVCGMMCVRCVYTFVHKITVICKSSAF